MSSPQAPLQHPLIRVGDFALRIRRSIDIREWNGGGGVLFYLCGFSDEIDDRVQRYTARLSDVIGEHSPTDALICSTSHLELTDSVIFWDGDQVVVVRGSSSNFPLYRSDSRVIATSLQDTGEVRLSRVGLAVHLASDLMVGTNEPNGFITTAFPDWKRFRRGAVTVLAAGRSPIEMPFPIESIRADTELTIDHVVEALRSAFANFIDSQRHVQCSILEVSGGFDSTLAGAAVRTHQRVMHGISAVYPYYEFRHEAPLQQSVADALGITRTVIDGTCCFPYSKVTRRPWFDEPSKMVVGARFTEEVGRFALSHGATKLYVGHGGDDLFDTDTSDLRPVNGSIEARFFTKGARRTMVSAIDAMRRSEWRHNDTGLFTYDGRLDNWVKEVYGASIRSPFSDIEVLKAARMWSAYCRSRRSIVDKTILVQAFTHLLPMGVVQRKGKIRYEGVWARAYHAHGKHIADTIDDCADILEEIGVLPSRIIDQVEKLQRYGSDAEDHVISTFAIADWLLSRGLQRAKDIDWVD